MPQNALLSALALGAVALTTPLIAQYMGQTYFTRSSIVRADARGTIVCIDKADWAEVGKTLEVYMVVRHAGQSKGSAPNCHRQLIGHGQIDHIHDDHFAHRLGGVKDKRLSFHD
jgi:hypothetical protein